MRKEYQLKGTIPPQKAIIPSHLIYEDFEHMITTIGAGTGDDWVARKSPQLSLGGDYSWYLVTKATTPAPGDYVFLANHLPFYVSDKIDAEFFFIHFTTDNQIMIILEFLSGYTNFGVKGVSNCFSAAVRFNCRTGELAVRDENLVYHVVDALPCCPGARWIMFGMQVDLEKQEYIKIRVGPYEKVVSGIKIRAYSVNLFCPIVNARIENITTTRSRAYVDNICLWSSVY